MRILLLFYIVYFLFIQIAIFQTETTNSPSITLKSQALTSKVYCNNRGHKAKDSNLCICMSKWVGHHCEKPLIPQGPIGEKQYVFYNMSKFYDWREIKFRKHRSKFYNLNPFPQIYQKDDFFPSGPKSIGYMNIRKKIAWISIREINKNYHLFNDQINVTDVLQGEGQTCYIFAALASLVNLPRGDQYIRNAFVVINEAAGIYVTQWNLFGRQIYVSVNDEIPVYNGTKKPIFAQIPASNCFWVAILEKSWAKIWKSYQNILQTSEDLLWNALTGAAVKRFLNVKTFLESNDKIFSILKPAYYTLSTIKTKLQSTFIPSHSFSILGFSGCDVKGVSNHESCLFHLYNPWGSDTAVSSFVKKFMGGKKIPMESMKLISNDKTDDGIIYIPFSLILIHFDEIISVAALENYHTKYEIIPLKMDVKNKLSIIYNLTGSDDIYISFELLNDEILTDQIKPFQIVDVQADNAKVFTSKKSENERGFVYKGLLISDIKSNNVIRLNVTIEKFNNDIIDTLFLTFYTNGEINRITKYKKNKGCASNCNEHGRCINQSVCLCDNGYKGIACSLTNDMIYPKPACGSNVKHSYCLSTGKRICFQGFNSSNDCNPCAKQDPPFCIDTEHCNNLAYRSLCPQTCLDGECYIPGSMTKCETTACNGNGNCNRTTSLCKCFPNYLPPTCLFTAT